jgi:hypothetical protein
MAAVPDLLERFDLSSPWEGRLVEVVSCALSNLKACARCVNRSKKGDTRWLVARSAKAKWFFRSDSVEGALEAECCSQAQPYAYILFDSFRKRVCSVCLRFVRPRLLTSHS